jgi:hypothetical protein
MVRKTWWMAVAAVVLTAASVWAQPVPKPFPRPAGEPPAKAEPAPPAPQTDAAPPAVSGEPNEASLGVPVYPGATYIESFDAGMGQRYYLFGTNASYSDIVSYYKVVLKDRGEEVFDQPATYMFDVGKFREGTMAFPPGITVKDYTWNGSKGYMAVKDSTATRFRTVVQIVPVAQ